MCFVAFGNEISMIPSFLHDKVVFFGVVVTESNILKAKLSSKSFSTKKHFTITYKKYNTVYNQVSMTEQVDLYPFHCANTLFKLLTVKQSVVYWQDIPFGC